MLSFGARFASARPQAGELEIFFLGQAGFAFKTGDGHSFAIDPYLSDCCERHFGFKRLMAYLCGPRDLPVEALLISHSHLDHCDTDSLPILMETTKHLIGARDVAEPYRELKLPESKLTLLGVHEEADLGWLKVTGMPCDHGELAPDALGLLIEVSGKRIFFVGDSCYRPELWEDPRLQGLDVLIFPINGAFDNLDSVQGAKVCAQLKPKLALPSHYWCFAQHGGDPVVYMDTMTKDVPDVPYFMMRPGESITV